ncbi:hypothetical protein [Streptomyces sp. DHE17-7]|uniref:hypothetical protein n=1 Tax=Streptomyces sp. DHE17-7 TaxID=2759949 RepID=UPI003FA725A0
MHGKARPPHCRSHPGKAGRAYREGANLTLEGAATGRLTWEEFLAERVAEKATEAPARS